MLALYRAGRQAEALEVYQDARARFIDELGIEPGPELKRLQAEILRHEAGLAAPDGRRPTDEEGEIVKALLAGRVVPVIGLDGAGDLAAHLASAFEVPDDRPGRPRSRVAVRRDDAGVGPALRRAARRASRRPSSQARCTASSPGSPRSCASAARRTSSSSRRTTTSRSSAPSRRRARSSTSSPTSRPGTHRGRFWHRPPGEPPRPIDVPNTYATELSLDRRTILLKLHGAVDPLPEREWESFVITEDDYIDYLGRSELTAVVPVALAARLRRSHFLFLGYEMADWNLRLILNRIWGERPVAYRSWAVQRVAEPARAGVLAALRRLGARRRSAVVRRAARAATGGRVSERPGVAVQGAQRLRGLRARRAPLLRARARDARSSSQT